MLVYSAEFLEFWKVYPKRVAKLAAFKAFQQAVKMGIEPEILIAGAKKYAEHVKDRDPQYTCHASTYLHQGRWDDEYDQSSIDTHKLTPHERMLFEGSR